MGNLLHRPDARALLNAHRGHVYVLMRTILDPPAPHEASSEFSESSSAGCGPNVRPTVGGPRQACFRFGLNEIAVIRAFTHFEKQQAIMDYIRVLKHHFGTLLFDLLWCM